MAAGADPIRDEHYALGVVMVALSGLSLSFIGLTLRFIEAADGWQILFWRALAFIATVLVFMAIRRPGRTIASFRAIGAAGLLLAACLAANMICYVWAMLHTTVANVVFILSASPFFAAIIGWVILGERVRPATWAAIAAAMAGIGVMMGSGIAGGTWLGSLIALGVPATYAVMIVVIRKAKAVDMIPATCLAGVLTALLCAPLVGDFALTPRDLGLSLLMGGVQVGAAFILLTLGARHVPAAEVGLIALTEAIFAPLWVWLFVGETPTTATLVGGAIVLGAVVAQGVRGMRGTATPRLPPYSDGTSR